MLQDSVPTRAVRAAVGASQEPILVVIDWARAHGFEFERGPEVGSMFVIDTVDGHRPVMLMTDGGYREAPWHQSRSLLAHLAAIVERRT